MFTSTLLIGCSQRNTTTVLVTNPHDFPFIDEILELSVSKLPKMENQSSHLIVKDKTTHEYLTYQFVDTDTNGIDDLLLILADIKANSKKELEIRYISGKDGQKQDSILCYSRFVPERTDDYAWENDKVAFRTFGPEAQKMYEAGIPGGTLSSGVDAWLKRVNYPIIDKWYEKELSGKGSYHRDDGEGLDNFHVGGSRGVGGTGIYLDSTYYFSKNFVRYRTITNGPLRTSFELVYNNYSIKGENVIETKIVSLDYGSNLTKYEISMDNIGSMVVGLTLHENDGNIEMNDERGWFSYWQPHGDSYLGTGLVIPNLNAINRKEVFLSEIPDESHLFVHMQGQVPLVFYSGYGWKKHAQLLNESGWQEYLDNFSRKLRHPLLLEITKK